MLRLLPLSLLLASPCVPASEFMTDDGSPVELGRVAWGRDHDAAFALARESGRPVLILFQEIPGCATCRNFGGGPLSSPLVVEAIEREFVPLLVQNNTGGADARWLKHYREPAWNNPVVRFFAPDGEELLPRADRVWQEGPLVERMVAALSESRREVPAYLELARAEANRADLARAAFAMHCFWVGEAALGAVEGVRETRVGWLDGREVVELSFDPAVTPLEELVSRARRANSADRLYVEARLLTVARRIDGLDVREWTERARDAKPSDSRRHLQASSLRFLPLTPLQEVRVNAALASREDARRHLSPGQEALLEALEAHLARDPRSLSEFERDRSGDLWARRARLAARLGLQSASVP